MPQELSNVACSYAEISCVYLDCTYFQSLQTAKSQHCSGRDSTQGALYSRHQVLRVNGNKVKQHYELKRHETTPMAVSKGENRVKQDENNVLRKHTSFMTGRQSQREF